LKVVSLCSQQGTPYSLLQTLFLFDVLFSHKRCANFVGVLVHNVVLIYSPDGTNVYVKELGSL